MPSDHRSADRLRFPCSHAGANSLERYEGPGVLFPRIETELRNCSDHIDLLVLSHQLSSSAFRLHVVGSTEIDPHRLGENSQKCDSLFRISGELRWTESPTFRRFSRVVLIPGNPCHFRFPVDEEWPGVSVYCGSTSYAWIMDGGGAPRVRGMPTALQITRQREDTRRRLGRRLAFSVESRVSMIRTTLGEKVDVTVQ